MKIIIHSYHLTDLKDRLFIIHLEFGRCDLMVATQEMPKGIHTVDLKVATTCASVKLIP